MPLYGFNETGATLTVFTAEKGRTVPLKAPYQKQISCKKTKLFTNEPKRLENSQFTKKLLKQFRSHFIEKIKEENKRRVPDRQQQSGSGGLKEVIPPCCRCGVLSPPAVISVSVSVFFIPLPLPLLLNLSLPPSIPPSFPLHVSLSISCSVHFSSSVLLLLWSFVPPTPSGVLVGALGQIWCVLPLVLPRCLLVVIVVFIVAPLASVFPLVRFLLLLALFSLFLLFSASFSLFVFAVWVWKTTRGKKWCEKCLFTS